MFDANYWLLALNASFLLGYLGGAVFSHILHILVSPRDSHFLQFLQILLLVLVGLLNLVLLLVRNLGLRLRVALVRLKLRLLLLLHRHELFVLVPVRRFRFGPQLLLAKVLLFRQTFFRICVQRSMQPE